MKSLTKLMSSGLLAYAVVFAAQANAAVISTWGATSKPANVPTNIREAIMNITNWILGFIAIIATLIVIYGGVLYLSAMGNDSQVDKAKSTITAGIIGIIICGLAYAIVIVVSTVILAA